LDGVSTGFVHGLTAGDVLVDFLGGHSRKPDLGSGTIADPLISPAEADTRKNLVAASGEGFEHEASVGGMVGLEEHPAIDDDGRVRSEHGLMRSGLDGPRLEFGEPSDIFLRLFLGQGSLIDRSGADGKGDSGLTQDFRAAW